MQISGKLARVLKEVMSFNKNIKVKWNSYPSESSLKKLNLPESKLYSFWIKTSLTSNKALNEMRLKISGLPYLCASDY